MPEPGAHTLSFCIRPGKRRPLASVKLDLHLGALQATFAREPGDDFAALGDHGLGGCEVDLAAVITDLRDAVQRPGDVRHLEDGFDPLPTGLQHMELGPTLVLDPVAAGVDEVLTSSAST